MFQNKKVIIAKVFAKQTAAKGPTTPYTKSLYLNTKKGNDPIKIAKELNRHLTNINIWMANNP